MSEGITDKLMMWVQIKNMVVVIATCLSVYYISPWMFVVMCCYTTVSYEKKDTK